MEVWFCVQIEMRKIAVEQLQQLQRASTSNDVITADDVIADDVTSASQVGDDSGHQQATNEWRHTTWPPEVLSASTGYSFPPNTRTEVTRLY